MVMAQRTFKTQSPGLNWGISCTQLVDSQQYVYLVHGLDPKEKARAPGHGLASGEGGIRTPGTREGTPDFESGPFDHSGTSPKGGKDKDRKSVHEVAKRLILGHDLDGTRH